MSGPNYQRKTIDRWELFKRCNYTPHPGQRVIHEAGTHDSGGFRYRIVCAGTRMGKTICAAHEMVAAALAPNEHEFLGWCVAPLHALADISFREVCRIFQEHMPEHILSLRETDGVLEILNLAGKKARILRKSTERGKVALVGVGVDAMIVDEASAVPRAIWEASLSTRLMDRQGWCLAISTPRGTSGWWADLLRLGLSEEDPEVFGVQLPSWTNPWLSKDDLRKQRRRLTDVAFRQEYGAELIAEGGTVFDPEAIEKCARVRKWEDPRPGAIYVAGLDLAFAQDHTVLTVARHLDNGACKLAYTKAWRRMPFDQQVDEVARILRKYGDAQVRVDATGLGAPVVQSMRSSDKFEGGVRAEVFSAQSKTSMVRNLQVMLERGRIALPTRELAPELHRQLTLFAYQDTDSTNVNGLRKMGAPRGEHDDWVASLLLLGMFFRGDSSGGSRIARKPTIPLHSHSTLGNSLRRGGLFRG